jgi:hypothetical protein
MRRIRLLLAAVAVMAAMLAMVPGPAMADDRDRRGDFERCEVFGDFAECGNDLFVEVDTLGFDPFFEEVDTLGFDPFFVEEDRFFFLDNNPCIVEPPGWPECDASLFF